MECFRIYLCLLSVKKAHLWITQSDYVTKIYKTSLQIRQYQTSSLPPISQRLWYLCCMPPGHNSILPNRRRSHKRPNYKHPSPQCRPPKHNVESLDAIVHPLKDNIFIHTQGKWSKKPHTNEPFWPLLYDFHAKRSWHMRLVAVTFDGNVLGFIESFVCTTTIYSFLILLRWTLIASDWYGCVNYYH